jgi:aminoglycoside phosphotransferase (APT) family kinase protein
MSRAFKARCTLTKFKGGQSNPTYKIEAPSGNYVLRRKPFGRCCRAPMRLTANSRCRRACRTGFPVARQYGLCTDESVVGSWFYVMGMVDGRTIWDGAMPNDTPGISRAKPISR